MLKSLSIFTGNANRALADEICKFVEIPLGRADVTHFSRRRDLRRDRRERSRRELLRRAAHVLAAEPVADGAADHDRRAQARVGRLDRRDHSVLRLRAAGSQGEAAHADHGEARREPDHRRRRRSRARDGSPRRSDPGLLRHSVRSPVLDAGADRGAAHARLRRRPDRRRVAGCRRRRARACLLASASVRASRSSTSAARRRTSAR